MNPTLAYKKGSFYGYLVKMIPQDTNLPNDDRLASVYWSVAPAVQNGPIAQTWYANKDELPFELREVDLDDMRFDS